MKKLYAYLSVSVFALASLTSCSRSDYAFKANASPYHTVITKPAVTPAESSIITVSPTDNLVAAADNAPAPVESPARTAARALAASPAAKTYTPVSANQAVSVADYKAGHKEVKAALKKLKKNDVAAPDDEQPAAEGKSQLTALLLAIFIGGLGIHRFYLGYTGIGIAQLLTLGGCGIWSLIDLIRIITGDLKPRGADYAKKL